MAVAQYPISFFATSRAEAGIHTGWTTESSGFGTHCSIPPEFEGPGGGLSPEDLFAQSLTNCFLATFKVFAEKSKLHFTLLEATTELKVDLDLLKRPVMKSAVVKVLITGASSVDRAKLLAQKAFTSGFILNSVKTELTLELDVTPEAAQ